MKITISLLTAAFLMLGCTQEPQVKQVTKKPITKTKRYKAVPPPPKKKIKLKEVEDENFSSDYMYPTTAKKSNKTTEVSKKEPLSSDTPQATTTEMTKKECIGLIGQEKFDKYAQMYGGASAPLKKCKMLKTL